MGLTDRLKDAAKEAAKRAEDAAAGHKDQLQQAVQKAGSVADQRTGGKYSEQIQKAAARADTVVGKIRGPGDAEPDAPATPAGAEEPSPPQDAA